MTCHHVHLIFPHLLKQTKYKISRTKLFKLFQFAMPPENFPGKWARNFATAFHTVLSFIVFLFFDFLETFLCIIYRFLDEFFEGKASSCYCERKGDHSDENEISETLYDRKNIFRKLRFLHFPRKLDDSGKIRGNIGMVNRWSDCGCDSCVAWMKNGDQKLHVVVKEPSQGGNRIENVIFLHGFLCSSSIWTETVFQNLSENIQENYRLIAVDLLGFGRSPKPRESLYTLKDHLEMIEKSVIVPFDLKSFHLVAHSMGCIIALSVADKYSNSVKSVTLLAPPYFPSSENVASLTALDRLAKRRLWPPFTFGSSIMSWYEHIGRCVCFFLCRNHKTWESLLKLITRKRELSFKFMDFTKHTHHSAWHCMHNVICGGAKYVDGYLETLSKHKVRLYVVHGDRDEVVPIECSVNIKIKVPNADVNIIANADHNTVIFGREKEQTQKLEKIWEFYHAE